MFSTTKHGGVVLFALRCHVYLRLFVHSTLGLDVHGMNTFYIKSRMQFSTAVGNGFFLFFFALRGVCFDFGMLLHIYVYQAVLRESPSLRLP